MMMYLKNRRKKTNLRDKSGIKWETKRDIIWFDYIWLVEIPSIPINQKWWNTDFDLGDLNKTLFCLFLSSHATEIFLAFVEPKLFYILFSRMFDFVYDSVIWFSDYRIQNPCVIFLVRFSHLLVRFEFSFAKNFFGQFFFSDSRSSKYLTHNSFIIRNQHLFFLF